MYPSLERTFHDCLAPTVGYGIIASPERHRIPEMVHDSALGRTPPAKQKIRHLNDAPLLPRFMVVVRRAHEHAKKSIGCEWDASVSQAVKGSRSAGTIHPPAGGTSAVLGTADHKMVSASRFRPSTAHRRNLIVCSRPLPRYLAFESFSTHHNFDVLQPSRLAPGTSFCEKISDTPLMTPCMAPCLSLNISITRK